MVGILPECLKQFTAEYPNGIDGHQVKLVFLDAQGTVTGAVQATDQLVSDHVAAVVTLSYNPEATVQQAEILNHADRSLERNVLDNLATTDKELAEEVRAMLFVFEDLLKLDDRTIQIVLKDVDQKDLALALRLIMVAVGARGEIATKAHGDGSGRDFGDAGDDDNLRRLRGPG